MAQNCFPKGPSLPNLKEISPASSSRTLVGQKNILYFEDFCNGPAYVSPCIVYVVMAGSSSIFNNQAILVTTCFAILEHNAPDLCPPVTEKCYLTHNGSFYDLRALSTAKEGHFWHTRQNGNDDFAQYRLSICGDFLRVPFCPDDSAVCKVKKEMTGSKTNDSSSSSEGWPFFASSTSQRLEMINDTYLQLTYFGRKCPNESLNVGFYATKILFECENL